MIKRDEWDKPCTGCGYCCKQALCLYALLLNAAGPPCGLLLRKGGRYWCRLLLALEGAALDRVAKGLCLGEGCIGPWMRAYLEEEKQNDTA
jgi:hypothetical protein